MHSFHRFNIALSALAISCVVLASPKDDDIASCEKIKNSKRRDECFEKLARKLNESKRSSDDIASFVIRSKQEATQSFLDPDSGKFRNLYVTKDNAGLSLCGEINSKNIYGGYVGFRRFIQHFAVKENSYEKVSIEPNQPQDAIEKIMSEVFAESWKLLCESMPTLWRE